MSSYVFNKSKASEIPAQYDPYHDDPSLNNEMAPPLEHDINIDEIKLNQLFLSRYNLDYIGHYFSNTKETLKVISYPKPTNTCFEKADILPDWSPLNVIKSLFFESSVDGMIYGVIIPETGCKLNVDHIKAEIGLSDDARLIKSNYLPENMTYGTCSPFIKLNDTVNNGGIIKNIIFDKETLQLKKEEGSLDDFSFGTDHRLSIQMNYYQCYKMLKYFFPNVVISKCVLCLSIEEKMIRKKGHIKVNYLFKSVNYSTAKSINNIYGYGVDVSSTIMNNSDILMANCIN